MVKIMIADDQQLIRESLKIILDSDPNFEVVKVVGSGQEVLDTLEIESIDIILMDVRMPSMSGVECTRLVKKKYPNNQK
jgi:DNA-binding NarL/FixJ family response regulator